MSNARSVYRTRIEVGEKKPRAVPGTFRLTPGLTGSTDITVGKHKIIDYSTYPLVRAMGPNAGNLEDVCAPRRAVYERLGW